MALVNTNPDVSPAELATWLRLASIDKVRTLDIASRERLREATFMLDEDQGAQLRKELGLDSPLRDRLGDEAYTELVGILEAKRLRSEPRPAEHGQVLLDSSNPQLNKGLTKPTTHKSSRFGNMPNWGKLLVLAIIVVIVTTMVMPYI